MGKGKGSSSRVTSMVALNGRNWVETGAHKTSTLDIFLEYLI